MTMTLTKTSIYRHSRWKGRQEVFVCNLLYYYYAVHLKRCPTAHTTESWLANASSCAVVRITGICIARQKTTAKCCWI